MIRHRTHRAFTLPESIIATTVAAALLSILLIRAPHSRHLSAQSESLANLRQFGSVTGNYAADYEDRFWSFSWRVGEAWTTQHPDLASGVADNPSAQSAQMTDIIRRRGGLPSMSRPENAFPALRSSHLVLADYLNTPALMSMAISPADANRVRWFRDPAAYLGNQLQPQPDVTGDDSAAISYLFSSSYELPPAFYSLDSVGIDGTVTQGPTHYQFFLTQGQSNAPVPLGGRRTAEVAFPSNKVLLHETAQHEISRQPVYWAYEHARIALLMVDGSAAVRVTNHANRGFQPGNPASQFPSVINYQPRSWEPEVSTTSQVGGVAARYRFTRLGLRGRDFDGQEATSAVPPP